MTQSLSKGVTPPPSKSFAASCRYCFKSHTPFQPPPLGCASRLCCRAPLNGSYALKWGGGVGGDLIKQKEVSKILKCAPMAPLLPSLPINPTPRDAWGEGGGFRSDRVKASHSNQWSHQGGCQDVSKSTLMSCHINVK
jgi:hypothetical protein